MKKSPHVHTEKDGASAFGLYVLLPMAVLFALIHKTSAPFDNQNAPVEDFQISGNKVSFYVKPLGNKKFEIPATADINRDSKLTLAYNIENDRLKSVKSVSHNGSVIWTNTL